MGDWGRKPDKRINWWKTPRTHLRNVGQKPKDVWWEEGLWLRKDLVGIRCYSVLSGVKLQMVKLPNASSPTLYQGDKSLATSRIPALLKTNLTQIPSLLPHFLTCFISFFAGCLHFRFARSLIVGLTIGGAVCRGGNIAVGFSRWSL